MDQIKKRLDHQENDIYQEKMVNLKFEEREKEGTRHNMTNTIVLFWSSRRIVLLVPFVSTDVQ